MMPARIGLLPIAHIVQGSSACAGRGRSLLDLRTISGDARFSEVRTRHLAGASIVVCAKVLPKVVRQIVAPYLVARTEALVAHEKNRQRIRETMGETRTLGYAPCRHPATGEHMRRFVDVRPCAVVRCCLRDHRYPRFDALDFEIDVEGRRAVQPICLLRCRMSRPC